MSNRKKYFKQYAIKNKTKIDAYRLKWCAENKDKTSSYRKKWYKKNKSYYLNWAKEDRKKNPKKHRVINRNIRIKRKIKVMLKYGGKCIACGCTELALLTMDHINDDGSKDRKAGMFGTTFYKALEKTEKREDLQILCWMCQHRKRWYGQDLSKWEEQKVFLDKL